MRYHSPELAQFLRQLSVTLTAGEEDPAQRSLDIMQGAALMRYVHLQGKHKLIGAHLSE